MILQALYEYYQRKAADPGSTIAPHGLEWKEIPVSSRRTSPLRWYYCSPWIRMERNTLSYSDR